jgi:hypothetical protein
MVVMGPVPRGVGPTPATGSGRARPIMTNLINLTAIILWFYGLLSVAVVIVRRHRQQRLPRPAPSASA